MKLPISVRTLKSSGIGKTVNKLNRLSLPNGKFPPFSSSNYFKETKNLVTQLLDKWKKEVREKSKQLSPEEIDSEAHSKIKKIPKKTGIFSEISGTKTPKKENSIKPDCKLFFKKINSFFRYKRNSKKCTTCRA